MTRHDILRDLLLGKTPVVSGDKEQRWLNWATMHQPLSSPSAFSLQGRHLNHFCVGSDPEFCFVDAATRNRPDAHVLGLHVGLAAGCDQNQRLAELRPWPSVSVVAHVAGILTALRWMWRVHYTHVSAFLWRAGAYFSGDGMGGHVHFGRKRPTRTEEVAALDGLARVFRSSGLFPNREWDRRIAGDRIGQHYGRPGDFRPQKHGYEYRSLPSWLQSPTMAFIAITLSKLAVLDPEITTSWAGDNTKEHAHFLLRGLAKLYKGRDDDAYILYHLLTVNGDAVFNVIHDADFAPAWGFNRSEKGDKKEENYILPASIQPSADEIDEIRSHLLFGMPLTFRKYPPSFRTELPGSDYLSWLPGHVAVGTRSGFGDLIHDLITDTREPIMWDYANDDRFYVHGPIVNRWTDKDKALLEEFYPGVSIQSNREKITRIVVPRSLCQAQTISGFKVILLRSGLFPIWTVSEVKAGSLEEWYAEHKQQPEKTWRDL